MNYTIKEVARHNTPIDCWLIAHNKVDDVTKFITQHPLGSAPLIKKAGTDCSVDYDFHPKSSKEVWEEYKIGYVNKPKESCCIIS